MLLEFWHDNKIAVVAAAALTLLLLSSVVEVPETEQAVVMNLGAPVRVINRFQPHTDFGDTGAGLSLRLPFIETVVRIDRRVLTVEMDRSQVTSLDQQRLEVDAFARFRIIDPVRMVRTAGTTQQVENQLQPILNSVMRQELGTHTFQALLTPERSAMMAQARLMLDKESRQYGAQIIDVRIKAADLPDGAPLDSAFDSMRAARDQAATTIRAQGLKDAQVIIGQAQARAAKISADAFGKDPQFYDFYRAMKSYEATFNPANHTGTTIVLSPDNDYLRQFRGGKPK